jgi:L-amino acid N-acyltransferase YncA
LTVGRGIGSVMLAALIDRSKEAGLREIVAVIATGGNDASLRLHRRFGFRDAGRLERVGYKFDRWLDTILLQRGLVE